MGLLRLFHGIARQIGGQDPGSGADVTQVGDATNNAIRVNRVAGGTETVQGPAAAGSAVSGNPVLVAGSDGTNVRTLATDASGILTAKAATLLLNGTGQNNGDVVIASTDVTGFKSWSLTASGSGGGNLSAYGSNDGVTWTAALQATYGASAGNPAISTNTSAGASSINFISGPVTTRYIKVLVNGSGTSTITGFLNLSSAPYASPFVGSYPTVNASVADGLANGSNAAIAWSQNAVYNGSTWDRRRTPNVFTTIPATSVTAGTPVTVWTPAAGKKFRLMGFMLSLSVAGAIIFKDGGNSNAELIRTALMAAGIGLPSPPMGNGILGSAANGTLNIDVTANGTVSGFVFGTQE